MPDAPTGRVVWATERRRDVSAGGERGRDYTAVVLGRWSAVEIQASGLTDLRRLYPEKAFILGQVFSDTTNSYKLIWFLAILSLLKRIEGQAFRLTDIFTEMAVAAWHPVCLYRLSLGRQDKLQDAVLECQQRSGLEPSASPDAIRKFVENSSEAKSQLEVLRRYVPTRFLAPWFPELRGKRDFLRDRLIKENAKESQRTPTPCPYYFEGSGAGESIKFNESWRAFLLENMAIVQAFAEYHLALYLQIRNPNVPGVVNKLRAPTARRLTLARRFWHLVRSDMEKTGMLPRFQDIYSGKPLLESFTIDHFLPWSFVVHDLLWNLTPVEAATNSMKGDLLPDLDLYLPRLARLHFAAVEAAKNRPTFLEDYTDCFKQDAVTLLTLGEGGFIAKYREVIVPQAQIARNQGFQSGWKLP